MKKWLSNLDRLDEELERPDNAIPNQLATKIKVSSAATIVSMIPCMIIQAYLLSDWRRRLFMKPIPYAKPMVASIMCGITSLSFMLHYVNQAYEYIPDVVPAPPVAPIQVGPPIDHAAAKVSFIK